MFRIACGLRERSGWEISPSEFWRMSPAEWWLIYDINVGDHVGEKEEDRERLHSLMDVVSKRYDAEGKRIEHNQV